MQQRMVRSSLCSKQMWQKSLLATQSFYSQPVRSFRQVNNLHEITYTANLEMA